MAGIEPASKEFNQRYTTSIVGQKVLVDLVSADRAHGPPADLSLASNIGVMLAAVRISRRPCPRSRTKRKDERDRTYVDQWLLLEPQLRG